MKDTVLMISEHVEANIAVIGKIHFHFYPESQPVRLQLFVRILTLMTYNQQ